LRAHGSRVGHRLFGLRPPPHEDGAPQAFRPGAAVRVRHGAVAFTLVPVHLDVPGAVAVVG
jgi:hypothetical protein